MIKTLKGQELRAADYAPLLARVDAILWQAVYGPLVALVRPALPKPIRADLAPKTMRSASPEELRNAAEDEGADALKRALQAGTVQMVPDPKGKKTLFAVVKPDRRISAGLKAFGCVRNKTTELWECAPGQVPYWVRGEASSYAAKMGATHDEAKRLLDSLDAAAAARIDAFDLQAGARASTTSIEEGWQASARALEVIPDLSATGQRALADAFAAKAKIPIKRMASEMIAQLRDEVDANASAGYRAEALAQRIRDQYAMGKVRADMIARQETNNFMAAYREARAADAGLSKYVWTIVGDRRTRTGHKDVSRLDIGMGVGVFTYKDKAPARYMSFGVPCNPGQDARCRCVDRPVIE